jgi:hypothetical protein
MWSLTFYNINEFRINMSFINFEKMVRFIRQPYSKFTIMHKCNHQIQELESTDLSYI